MELLKFEDTCIIKRYDAQSEPDTGGWDECEPTTVYEGSCMYQEGGTGFNFPVIQHSAVVFLPDNNVSIEVNDEVVITTYKDRQRKAYVQYVKDVKLPLHKKEYTRIELKQNI